MELLNPETIAALKLALLQYWPHGGMVLLAMWIVANKYPEKWNIFLTLLKFGDHNGGPKKQAAVGAKAPDMTIVATNGTAKEFAKRLREQEKINAANQALLKSLIKKIDAIESALKKLTNALAYIRGWIDAKKKQG